MRLQIKGVTKDIVFHGEKIKILQEINLDCESGKVIAITGNSGSGKSTLLNILSLIDKCNFGEYIIEGQNLFSLTEKQKLEYRANNMGIVFQQFNLLNNMNCYNNVKIPLYVNPSIAVEDRDKIIKKVLEQVGLSHRMYHFPKTLSGGEAQRIAIARAMINNPKLLFADEPTGNVDADNEKEILEIFRKFAKEDRFVFIVTHSDRVKNMADRVFKIIDGHLEEEK